MLSKMIIDLARRSRTLEAAIRSFSRRAAASLTAFWATLDEDRRPPVSEEERLLAIGRWLARNRQRMTAAEEDLAAARQQHREIAAQVRALARELREKLMDVRRSLEGTYGAGQSQAILGLGPDLPTGPAALQRMGRAAVRRLDVPGFTLPEPRLRGSGPDVADLKAEILPALERLETALRQRAPWRLGERRALACKRKAYARQELAVGRARRYLRALSALAGEDFPG